MKSQAKKTSLEFYGRLKYRENKSLAFCRITEYHMNADFGQAGPFYKNSSFCKSEIFRKFQLKQKSAHSRDVMGKLNKKEKK
jgi:hypothetical protein